jgi:hypothetical protein
MFEAGWLSVTWGRGRRRSRRRSSGGTVSPVGFTDSLAGLSSSSMVTLGGSQATYPYGTYQHQVSRVIIRSIERGSAAL